MSRAIASARQRRAGVETPNISQPAPSPSQAAGGGAGLTLPQVIALVDTRLIKLEQFMKETQDGNKVYKPVVEFRDVDSNQVSAESDPEQLTDLNDILEEYNSRFVLLAEELAVVKDTLLSLQKYTMDVNKMLLEDRGITLPVPDQTSTFTMTNGVTIEENAIVEESNEA
jgi:hypothetical protein